MKQEYKISMKLFAFVMALLMLLVSLPMAAFASAISTSKDNTSTSVGANSEVIKKDVIVIEEDETLRDENIKHFRLSDGTTKAVVYAQAVHYKDADGNWVDIDNALTLNGNEYSSNNKQTVKFANKSGSNGLVNIKDGDYKIDFTPLNTNKVSVVIENPQSNNSRKFEDMSVLNNLVSKAVYADIYDGIDIEYILVGNNIKENIIVKEKQDSYTFSFELTLNKLSAELIDGAIILSDYDTDEQIYEIPVPYMLDANNVYSNSVEYSLVQDSKWKYTLTVTADAEWINADDRAFPVTIDPTIGTNRSTIETTTVKNPNFLPVIDGTIKIGFGYIAYLKQSEFPTLPNDAYMTEAKLNLTRYGGAGVYIGAYQVLTDWDEALTWEEVQNNEKGRINLYPSDYNFIHDTCGEYSWDITEIVRQWNQGATNYGIALKSMNEQDYESIASFYNPNNEIENCPMITITYRDMKGVESYYPLISQSMGIGGTGYVNLATGQLTYCIDTLTTTENLFGFTTSMIYNSALAGEKYQYGNAQVGYVNTYEAYGFKVNVHETLIKNSHIGTDGLGEVYYVWADGDGTEHYFYQSTKSGEQYVYYDEDGLQLKLITNMEEDGSTSPYGQYCKIVDSNFNERIFANYQNALTSNTLGAWYLDSYVDKNGNKLRIQKDGSKRPNDIKLTPNGTTDTITMISSLYNSSGVLTLLWCESAKEGFLFRHSDTPQNELNLTGGRYLREMLHLSCASNISWREIINEFISDFDNEYEGITVNSLIRYEYTENGLLESIENTFTGQSLKYEYRENGQVSNIKEYGANNALGQSIYIDYDNELTHVRTSGANDIIGDRDDLFNYYVLDNHGRVVSSYTTNFEGNKIYGATVGQYVDDNENAKNSIKSSSIIGITSSNYLINGDFEHASNPKEYWTSTSNVYDVPRNNNHDQTNTKALLLDLSTENVASISQNVYLNEGKYTLSLDASAIDASNVNFVMKIYEGSNLIKTEKFPVFKEDGECTDYLVSFDFNIDGTDYKNIKVLIYAETTGECGPIYVDNVMLAKSVGVSEYNYVTHSSFENSPINTYTGGDTAINVGDYWYYETINNANGIVKTPISNLDTQSTYIEYYNSDFENTLKINGSISEAREVSQELFLSNDFECEQINKALTLTVSGFGRSTIAMSGNKSEFGLKLYYQYLDESEETQTVCTYFPFNPNVDWWQFTAGTVTIPSNIKPTKIWVACVYSHNLNGARFDNITVTKSLTNTTAEYEYYEDGKIKYHKQNSDEAFYHYENGLLIDSFVNKVRTQYSYDTYNRVKEETTYVFVSDLSVKDYETIKTNATFSLLNTKTKYVYDNNPDYDTASLGPGLLTSVEYMSMNNTNGIEANAEKIVTTNTYYTGSNCKIYGALKTTTDSLGKETMYFVNQNNGRLIALIEPDNTGLYYTYDGTGKLIMVQPAKYQNNTYSAVTDSANVIYNYNSKNQLESINANGTVYTFTYDDFGNQKGVAIDDNPIVNQTQNVCNGKVTSNTYANGTVVLYEYDELERTSKTIYQNGDNTVEYTYEYDLKGNLHKITDSSNNTVTTYKYDTSNKLVGHTDYDSITGKINSANYYSYDEEDRLHMSQHRTSYLVSNATTSYDTILVEYTYTYNNRDDLRFVDIDILDRSSKYIIQYDYDDFKRMTGKTITLNGMIDVDNAEYDNVIKNIINYSYISNGKNTSLLIGQYNSILNVNGNQSTDNVFNYEYDDKGNIIAIRDGSTQEAQIIYSYEYDELGQLIRENNSVLNKTYTYSYDNNGNITSVKTYAYTLGEITGESISNDTYGYGNNDWKDQLTSFNGYTIVYDGMGNPTKAYTEGNESNPEYELTWNYIRRLMSYVNDDYTVSYTYNDEGIRTSKTVNGVKHEYVLEGSTILYEKYNDVIVIYFYDEAGLPIGMAYRKASEANLGLAREDQFEYFLFTKNLQGDILNIYSEDGTKVASYNYDAWGNHTVTNYTSDNIGNINPFRYRGYYFDSETNFYYLNSRYYDPEIKRFISADSIDIIGATPDGLTDKNLYAYCDNNPVMRRDDGGKFWHILTGAVVGAVIGAVGSVLNDIMSGETDFKTIAINAGVSAAFGALGGALTAIGMPTAASIATGAIMGGLEETTKQLLTKNPDEELDVGSIITSTIAGGIAGAFTGKGALNDLNQKKYITSQKNIRSKAISSGKPKIKANAYFKKMTNTIYGFGGMASKQAAYRVSTSMGISWGTNKLLGIDMP